MSFVKPMAFSRYFVVLLPALVPVLAVQIGALELNRLGRGCGSVVLSLMLISWWGPGFAELDAGVGGVREQDQFRLISQRTSGLEERYSPRSRLFNLSDRMEVAMGRISSPSAPWCSSPPRPQSSPTSPNKPPRPLTRTPCSPRARTPWSIRAQGLRGRGAASTSSNGCAASSRRRRAAPRPSCACVRQIVSRGARNRARARDCVRAGLRAQFDTCDAQSTQDHHMILEP